MGLRESFSRSLTLIQTLIGILTGPIDVVWDPQTWLNDVLLCLESEVRWF